MSHARRVIGLKTRKPAGTSVEMAPEPPCRDDGATVEERTAAVVPAAGIVGERLRGSREAPEAWWSHKPAAGIRALLGAEISKVAGSRLDPAMH